MKMPQKFEQISQFHLKLLSIFSKFCGLRRINKLQSNAELAYLVQLRFATEKKLKDYETKQ